MKRSFQNTVLKGDISFLTLSSFIGTVYSTRH